MKNKQISCVVPAYNEEKFIGYVLEAIPECVANIVVVDDASTDGTGACVAAIDDSRIVLIRHDSNRGIGGAVVTGYRKALELNADIVVKMDADGQMDPMQMTKLVFPVAEGRADYAKGVRFRDRSIVREMPLSRFIGNLGLSFFTKIASGYWDVFDPTNGYTAIHRSALKKLDLRKVDKGFLFETAMLTRLYRINAVVEDVAMEARYGKETGSFSLLSASMKFPSFLLRAFVKRILWRYFIYDFSAFSLFFTAGSILFGFGFFFGLYHWMVGVSEGTATPTGTIMLSVVTLLLGFQLLLQAISLDIANVPKKPVQSNAEES